MGAGLYSVKRNEEKKLLFWRYGRFFLKANLIIVRIPTVFPRVNKMLGRVGKLVESLDAERKTLEEKLQRLQTSEEDKVEQSSKEKHLVSHYFCHRNSLKN